RRRSPCRPCCWSRSPSPQPGSLRGAPSPSIRSRRCAPSEQELDTELSSRRERVLRSLTDGRRQVGCDMCPVGEGTTDLIHGELVLLRDRFERLAGGGRGQRLSQRRSAFRKCTASRSARPHSSRCRGRSLSVAQSARIFFVARPERSYP